MDYRKREPPYSLTIPECRESDRQSEPSRSEIAYMLPLPLHSVHVSTTITLRFSSPSRIVDGRQFTIEVSGHHIHHKHLSITTPWQSS